ncbi:hypothetical protein J8273_0976 [Carpediemonas membranifera]|uniref:Uncharacterized protein n=1 Tax=Carpediemonas membranifera TaxID=201153 RepID=A0A8J6B9N1_9EUKA|nr:hypothetical protein J8273_0976 [Carpediemonas membranifera]|eukprot:KAG9397069.1 hypothetical protein J8273_0976 [Carpediemonas membranifera]
MVTQNHLFLSDLDPVTIRTFTRHFRVLKAQFPTLSPSDCISEEILDVLELRYEVDLSSATIEDIEASLLTHLLPPTLNGCLRAMRALQMPNHDNKLHSILLYVRELRALYKHALTFIPDHDPPKPEADDDDPDVDALAELLGSSPSGPSPAHRGLSKVAARVLLAAIRPSELQARLKTEVELQGARLFEDTVQIVKTEVERLQALASDLAGLDISSLTPSTTSAAVLTSVDRPRQGGGQSRQGRPAIGRTHGLPATPSKTPCPFCGGWHWRWQCPKADAAQRGSTQQSNQSPHPAQPTGQHDKQQPHTQARHTSGNANRQLPVPQPNADPTQQSDRRAGRMNLRPSSTLKKGRPVHETAHAQPVQSVDEPQPDSSYFTVQGKVNGETQTILIDSGSAPSCISQLLAERLKATIDTSVSIALLDVNKQLFYDEGRSKGESEPSICGQRHGHYRGHLPRNRTRR